MPGRNKHKQTMEDPNDKIFNKLEQLEDHISELKADNKTLCEQLSDIKNDYKNIEQQLVGIKNDNKALLLRVNTLEQDKLKQDSLVLDLQNKVSVLEEKADEHEQYSKRDNLLIQGLNILKPYSRAAETEKTPSDSTVEEDEQWSNRDIDIMKSNVITFAKTKLKIDISPSDISTVHELKSKSESRKGICIVRFTNRGAREKFYRSRTELYADKQQNRIYINEHLTQRNANIYREARELRKNGKVTHAWTKNCRVLVRLRDETVVHIKNNDFFKRFR